MGSQGQHAVAPRRIVHERAGRSRNNPLPFFEGGTWSGPGTSTINPEGSASKLLPPEALSVCIGRRWNGAEMKRSRQTELIDDLAAAAIAAFKSP